MLRSVISEYSCRVQCCSREVLCQHMCSTKLEHCRKRRVFLSCPYIVNDWTHHPIQLLAHVNNALLLSSIRRQYFRLGMYAPCNIQHDPLHTHIAVFMFSRNSERTLYKEVAMVAIDALKGRFTAHGLAVVRRMRESASASMCACGCRHAWVSDVHRRWRPL